MGKQDGQPGEEEVVSPRGDLVLPYKGKGERVSVYELGERLLDHETADPKPVTQKRESGRHRAAEKIACVSRGVACRAVAPRVRTGPGKIKGRAKGEESTPHQ